MTSFSSMTPEEYLKERIEQFQGWYDGKAVGAKRRYFQVRVIAVTGSVLVPVTANLFPASVIFTRYVTTFLGLVVSLAVALDSVYHFGDQWKNYRSTEQFLSREKFLFRTGEGPFKGMEHQEAFILMVERCEAQIAAENSATLNVIAPAPQKSPSSTPDN